MIATIGTVVAAGIAWLVTRVSVDELARKAAVQASNHRGIPVASTGGVALLTGVVAGAAVAALTMSWSSGQLSSVSIRQFLVLSGITTLAIAVTGFAAIGLYDDIAGDPSQRGWKAHLTAVKEARATPGAIKVVAGGALALLIGGGGSLLDILTAGAIVALSANLINAADGRPLRAIKFAGVWLVALVVISAITSSPPAIGASIVLAACLAALWRPEAQERIMLGDTGANAIGAALGALTLATERASGDPGVGTGRWVLLGSLVILTLVSAKPGFGAIIEKVGPLKGFDLLGRQPDPLRDDPVD